LILVLPRREALATPPPVCGDSSRESPLSPTGFPQSPTRFPVSLWDHLYRPPPHRIFLPFVALVAASCFALSFLVHPWPAQPVLLAESPDYLPLTNPQSRASAPFHLVFAAPSSAFEPFLFFFTIFFFSSPGLYYCRRVPSCFCRSLGIQLPFVLFHVLSSLASPSSYTFPPSLRAELVFLFAPLTTFSLSNAFNVVTDHERPLRRLFFFEGYRGNRFDERTRPLKLTAEFRFPCPRLVPLLPNEAPDLPFAVVDVVPD